MNTPCNKTSFLDCHSVLTTRICSVRAAGSMWIDFRDALSTATPTNG